MEEKIPQAPTPAPTVPPVPMETKKKSNLPRIGISLVVISLIAVAGVMFGMQIEKRKVKVWTEPPLIEEPTNTPPSGTPQVFTETITIKTAVTLEETSNLVVLSISDGKRYGFLNKIYSKSGKKYIDINLIEWLTGAKAEEACIKDEECPANCIQPYCFFKGYYTRQYDPPKIGTLPIDDNCTFEIYDRYDPSNKYTNIFFDSFQKYISGDWVDELGEKRIPSGFFWITILNGKVVNIQEEY